MTDETAPPTLDQSIENTQGLTTVLGGVFMVGGIMQALGWVEAGVPAWLNIAIPIAVLVLAQLLPKKSLLVTAALGVIFLILAVDTLVSTGFVLSSWGVLPTIVVIVRYLILLSATRELAQLAKLLWEERTMAERVAKLKAADSAAGAPTDSGAASVPLIDVSNNSSALVFKIFSGLLVVGGLISGSAMLSFGETTVGTIAIVGFAALAFGSYYVAGMEERYLPGLVGELKTLAEGEQGLDEVRAKLVAAKGRGSRALAAAIVNERIPIESAFATSAARIIAEIDMLDDDAAFALRRVAGDSSEFVSVLGNLLPTVD